MKVKVYKLSLVSNIADANNLEQAKAYFEQILKYKTQYTKAKRTTHRYSIRKGQKLGFKLNLYGTKIHEFINSVEHINTNLKSIDPYGNVNIGIMEYHQVKELVHNPDLANFGFCMNIHFAYDGLYIKGVKKAMYVNKTHIVDYIKNKYSHIKLIE